MNRLTFDDSGELDEILRHKTYFHLERMDENRIWLKIDDLEIDLFVSGKKLKANVIQSDPD